MPRTPEDDLSPFPATQWSLVRAEFADVLDRVDSVVAFAPPHVELEHEPEAFAAIVRSKDLDFFLGEVTGILRQRIARSALDGAPDPSLMFREDCDRLERILADAKTRHPAVAMLRRAVPNDGKKLDRGRAALIAADYAKVRVRHLIVWGRDDDTLGPSVGHKLRDHLPDARLCVVSHARHSVPVERPRISLNLIRDFLAHDLASPAARADGTTPVHSRARPAVWTVDGRTSHVPERRWATVALFDNAGRALSRGLTTALVTAVSTVPEGR